MKYHRLIFPMLLLIALTGAPFGMGRMMDGAHHTMQMADHGRMAHDDTPMHKSSTPHFVMCAAWFDIYVGETLSLERLARNETMQWMPTVILHGTALLPDLPPPRV
jgi:hypothetical protein